MAKHDYKTYKTATRKPALPPDELFEKIKRELIYNPETGKFTRTAHNRYRPDLEGQEAGSPSSTGHILICIGCCSYLAHRLAWLYTYGRWPNGEIDHINRNRADNRLANLREATHRQNNANKSAYAHCKSGFKGVVFVERTGRYRATIRTSEGRKHLGYFDSPEEASAAYQSAAYKFYGEFACTA